MPRRSAPAPAEKFFFTLVTGPRKSLSLKLSDTRVYVPQLRARLGTEIGTSLPNNVAHGVGCRVDSLAAGLPAPRVCLFEKLPSLEFDVCVCVCVRERESAREGYRESVRETETETERESVCVRERAPARMLRQGAPEPAETLVQGYLAHKKHPPRRSLQ